MKPKLLEIQLTGSCNLKCNYCGNSEEYLLGAIAHKGKILKAISELKPETILLTGGEVYLEWDLLIDILESIGSNYEFILSSNLTLISKNDLQLLIDKYEFKTFHSSFNDLNHGMSYKIRKSSELERKKLIENLKYLASRSVMVKVETILTKDTIDHLFEINNLLYSFGIRNHKLEFLVPIGQANTDIELDIEYVLDKIYDFYTVKNNDSILILTCFPQSPCSISHKIFSIQEKDLVFNKCVDGKETCYLLANGTLLPCFLFPDTHIDTKYTSYLEEWQNSPYFEGFRETITECNNCYYNFFEENSTRKICSNGCQVINYLNNNNEFGARVQKGKI